MFLMRWLSEIIDLVLTKIDALFSIFKIEDNFEHGGDTYLAPWYY